MRPTTYLARRQRAIRPQIPDALYPSDVQVSMPQPSHQLTSSLSAQLTRADKDVLDLLGAWPLCTRAQLAGLMGGVTLRRVDQALHSLMRRRLVLSDDSLYSLTDEGLRYLARRDRAAVSLTLDRWSAEPSNDEHLSTQGAHYAPSPPSYSTTPASRTSPPPSPPKLPAPRTTTYST